MKLKLSCGDFSFPLLPHEKSLDLIAMLGFEGHADLFVGTDPMALERHFRVLSHISFHGGRCWPLDLALWDLAGKITGQPCWKLLGGLSNRVQAYASSGTLRAPADMGDAAERFMGQGFAAMKIRFHRGDWREDVRALEAVRARVGNGLELMVDCNQGWRQPWDTQAPWSLKDAAAVTVASQGITDPVTVFDDKIDIPWEVEWFDFRG